MGMGSRNHPTRLSAARGRPAPAVSRPSVLGGRHGVPAPRAYFALLAPQRHLELVPALPFDAGRLVAQEVAALHVGERSEEGAGQAIDLGGAPDLAARLLDDVSQEHRGLVGPEGGRAI